MKIPGLSSTGLFVTQRLWSAGVCLWLTLMVSACQTLNKSSLDSKVAAQVKTPVILQLKGAAGRQDVSRYYSHSIVHSYEEGQMTKEREELVDFAILNTVQQVDLKMGRLHLSSRTVKKDGTVDLHDMAFPEMGEEINFVFGFNGQVLRAGDYDPSSVFYVPPIPLPHEPVNVGDTWQMQHVWTSKASGIPLQVDVVGILKGFVSCGSKGICADLELSGNVNVLAVTAENSKFSSEMWGRVFFSIDYGDVVWSEVRSREEMVVANANMLVISCLSSQMQSQTSDAKKWQQTKCTPVDKVIEKTPDKISI